MCGVVGVIGTPDAAKEAFLSLVSLQHRGQDAAGILTYDDDGFHRVKNVGLVESVFNRESVATLSGNVAIGHTRYATIGRGDPNEVQPMLINHPFGIGLVHNGNLINVAELKKDLLTQSKRRLITRSDSEIMLNLLADELARANGSDETSEKLFEKICAALNQIHSRVNGSYSIITLIAEHGLLAYRDPRGIRPLVWGQRKNRREKGDGVSHMVSSESVCLDVQGYSEFRDLAPGEILFIDLQGNVFNKVLNGKPQSSCMFEWVYFASPESEIDKIPVYGARIQLGKGLAAIIKKRMEKGDIAPDLIVPVPETSRIAAISLSEELGVPYREVLIKNRYIKRTFILDTQEKRQAAVNLKLSPVKSEIVGKKVLLVDDSIVRGTTSKKIIELVRNAGAKEVYFVSTCPPIRHPCYYGIDFPDERELIASGRSAEAIEKELGADAVIYQDIDSLKEAVFSARKKSSPTNELCMACLTGKYPTDIAAATALSQARSADRKVVGGEK